MAGLRRTLKKWHLWEQRHAPWFGVAIALIVLAVLAARVWDVTSWWDDLDAAFTDEWDQTWRAALVVGGLGALAVLSFFWLIRLLGRWWTAPMRFLRWMPLLRPRVRLVAVPPSEETEGLAQGMPALVAEARRYLEEAGRTQQLAVATPLHGFGEFIAPLTQGPGEAGWLAVALVGLHHLLPFEDFTMRMTLRGGAQRGVTLELYRGRSLRLATSLWHPVRPSWESIVVPFDTAARPELSDPDDVAQFFARPAAAWLQEVLTTCVPSDRRGSPLFGARPSCQQRAASSALVEQGLAYRYAGAKDLERRSYDLAFRANPQNWLALFNLGMLDMESSAWVPTIDKLEEVVRKTKPRRDRLWHYAMYNLGTAYLHHGMQTGNSRLIASAVEKRCELVQRGDAFLARRGWRMTGPLAAREPLLFFRTRRFLSSPLPGIERTQRNIEEALRKDGPIGIAAAATALRVARNVRALEDRTDDDLAVEELDFAKRGRAGIRGGAVRTQASTWYNLACHGSACRDVATAGNAFRRSLQATEPHLWAERIEWARHDPVLEWFTRQRQFQRIVDEFMPAEEPAPAPHQQPLGAVVHFFPH